MMAKQSAKTKRILKARLAEIRDITCFAYGCGFSPCDPAHVKSRGAGGTYRDIIPLCHRHHQEQHTIGILTFARKYHTTLEKMEEEAKMIAEMLDEEGYNVDI